MATTADEHTRKRKHNTKRFASSPYRPVVSPAHTQTNTYQRMFAVFLRRFHRARKGEGEGATKPRQQHARVVTAVCVLQNSIQLPPYWLCLYTRKTIHYTTRDRHPTTQPARRDRPPPLHFVSLRMQCKKGNIVSRADLCASVVCLLCVCVCA